MVGVKLDRVETDPADRSGVTPLAHVVLYVTTHAHALTVLPHLKQWQENKPSEPDKCQQSGTHDKCQQSVTHNKRQQSVTPPH